MRLIDKIALNRLIQIIADLVIRLAKVFAKNKPNKVVDPLSPVKPNRPRPLKRVIDNIDHIVPLPWRKK
jgi:hypothetical protein